MLQQIAGHSDEVTIEQGESKGLPVFDIDDFDVFDVVRCICSLFVQGPGKQHQPRRASTPSEAPSQRREEVWSKVGVFCYYSCSLSVQAIPCGILRDQRTDTTLRVGQLLTKGAQRYKNGANALEKYKGPNGPTSVRYPGRDDCHEE